MNVKDFLQKVVDCSNKHCSATLKFRGMEQSEDSYYALTFSSLTQVVFNKEKCQFIITKDLVADSEQEREELSRTFALWIKRSLSKCVDLSHSKHIYVEKQALDPAELIACKMKLLNQCEEEEFCKLVQVLSCL